MHEKGCLFQEYRKRKRMGSEATLAHPHTKIREETPPPLPRGHVQDQGLTKPGIIARKDNTFAFTPDVKHP